MNAGGKIFMGIVGVATALILYNVNQSSRARQELNQARQIAARKAAAEQKAAAAAAAAKYHWQIELSKSADLASFVRTALPAAESGNADAQVALHDAFADCAERLRSPAPGAQPLSAELMNEGKARCTTLASEYPDLAAEARRWHERALESKHPRALMTEVLRQISQPRGKSEGKGEYARRLAEARTNMLTALRADDPWITWDAAETLHAFFPGDPRVQRAYWVWKLAACRQGVPCGPEAKWLRNACQVDRRCTPGESGEDYLRRRAGDFASLHAHARNLAAMIQDGGLSDHDFEMSVVALDPGAQTAAAQQD